MSRKSNKGDLDTGPVLPKTYAGVVNRYAKPMPDPIMPQWAKELPLVEPVKTEPEQKPELEAKPVPKDLKLKFPAPGQLLTARPSRVRELAEEQLKILERELLSEIALNPAATIFPFTMETMPIDVIALVGDALRENGWPVTWDGAETLEITLPSSPLLGIMPRANYSKVTPL